MSEVVCKGPVNSFKSLKFLKVLMSLIAFSQRVLILGGT